MFNSIVEIINTNTVDGETETVRTVGQADISRGSSTTIRYIEKQDGENIPVTIDIGDKTVVIHRESNPETEMRVALGKQIKGVYNTPFGTIDTCITGRVFEKTQDDFREQIYIEYDINLGGIDQYHTTKITFKNKKQVD